MTAVGISDKINRTFSAVRSCVTAATSDTLLLPANSARVRAFIYNDAESPMYVGLGTAGVTKSDFSIYIASKLMQELPEGFTGMVRGVWETASGYARITEMT